MTVSRGRMRFLNSAAHRLMPSKWKSRRCVARARWPLPLELSRAEGGRPRVRARLSPFVCSPTSLMIWIVGQRSMRPTYPALNPIRRLVELGLRANGR